MSGTVTGPRTVALTSDILTADELPRIIHDLGPRYVSRFQAGDLIRFLTYEAATALNINLFARAEQTRGSAAEIKGLINSFKNGLGVAESSILFALSPATTLFENKETGDLNDATLVSDVFIARCNGLDLAMWEIGGAAVALRLVQLASVRCSSSTSIQTIETDTILLECS